LSRGRTARRTSADGRVAFLRANRQASGDVPPRSATVVKQPSVYVIRCRTSARIA
jgi:hypothetical protein